MAKISFFLLLSILMLGILTCSQMGKTNSEPKDENPSSDLSFLSKAIEALEQETIFRPARLGLSIRRRYNHEIVFSYQGDKTMVPASGMKAITTATALGILGEDFRYLTQIQHDGEIREGSLEGNIYIRGGGDPSLASRYLNDQSLDQIFATWSAALKEKGIRQVQGQIIADESAFFGDIAPGDWMWSDMGNYFGAPAGALNVMDNTYELLFQPASLGKPAKIIGTQPADINIRFINEVRTGPVGSGDQASISGGPYDRTRYVSGTVPAGGTFKIKGSIPDPGLYLAKLFRAYLQKAGIRCEQEPSTSRLLFLEGKGLNQNPSLLSQYQSFPLSVMIRPTNQYSINLYAEAMLQAIALKSKGTSHTPRGAEAVLSYWNARGLDTLGFFLRDGSGLSRSNGISPKQFSHILSLAAQESYFNTFYQSLPIAGVNGTMAHVGARTALQNNMRAKSGYMSRVISYSGYFKSRAGHEYTFSLIVNDHTGGYSEVRKKLSALMLRMLDIP